MARSVGATAISSVRYSRILNAYHNRAIATQEVIEELNKLATDLGRLPNAAMTLASPTTRLPFMMPSRRTRGAVEAMGDDTLKVIAAELISKVRQA
jgi:type I restriction enzyme R subunit